MFLARLPPNSHQTWVIHGDVVFTQKTVATWWRLDVMTSSFRFWDTVSVFLVRLCLNSHQTWRRHRAMDSTQKERRDVMTSWRNDIFAFYQAILGVIRGLFQIWKLGLQGFCKHYTCVDYEVSRFYDASVNRRSKKRSRKCAINEMVLSTITISKVSSRCRPVS